MIIAEARGYRVDHDVVPYDIRVADRPTAEMLHDALDAACDEIDDAVEREREYLSALTGEEQKTLERERPSARNPVCECKGNHVCVRHALIEIIDRLTCERYT